MLSERYDISPILKCLYDVADGIGEKTYTSARPKAVTPRMNDFTVVSVAARLAGNESYGTAVGRISLYIRRGEQGMENVARASQMQRAVYSKLPLNDGRYILGRPSTYPMGDDGNGFMVYHIQFSIIVI